MSSLNPTCRRTGSFFSPRGASPGLFILVLLTFILGACSGSLAGGPQREVDGLGREVLLPAHPQRIVSLAPSNTELLFAAGAGPRVVGRDDFSDYPAEAAAIPSIGGSMGVYSFEQIAALQPDLVLASEINTPEQVKSLEDLGLAVYYLPNPADVRGMLDNLRLVGRLTGSPSQADKLARTLEQRIEAVTSALPAASEPVGVFYELDGMSEPAKPWTVGAGTYIDELITMAGGRNVTASSGPGYIQVSLEALLLADPQVILLGDAAYGATPDSVAGRPSWSGISAVRTGQVYAIDDNLVSRPGPRLVDGLEEIRRLLDR